MEKFFALSEEKQASIIEAGFMCFGKMGYKKASVGDIASSAGISKSMLFHYFGNKKNLYVFLADTAFDTLMDSFKEVYDPTLTDIFDKLLNLAKYKVATLKRYTYLLPFFMSMYHETDDVIKAKVTQLLAQGDAFRTNMVFSETDLHKFKDSVDPKLVIKLLMRYSEGFADNTHQYTSDDLDAMLKEFEDCTLMLKMNFYKPEYL